MLDVGNVHFGCLHMLCWLWEMYIFDVFISDAGGEKCIFWMTSEVMLVVGNVYFGCLHK